MTSDSELPAGFAVDLGRTEESTADQIEFLKGQLHIAQDALEEQTTRSAKLEAEIKILRDNQPIKTSAVRFAKFFLVAIPIFCACLIIASSVSISLVIDERPARFVLKFLPQFNSYTQAALVVSPIVFVGAVLGFLLKGAFSGRDEDQQSALTLVAQLLSQAK